MEGLSVSRMQPRTRAAQRNIPVKTETMGEQNELRLGNLGPVVPYGIPGAELGQGGGLSPLKQQLSWC